MVNVLGSWHLEPASSRTDRLGRAAGLVSAGSMGLYLGVKVLWIATALLLGSAPEGWNGRGWIALNAATAAMAAVGIVVGLALAHDWGQRIPAGLVVPPLWLACGFLVTMLPYLLLVPVLDAVGAGGSSDTTTGSTPSQDLPAWESVLLGVGFAGMGLGLLVGVPAYIRRRWPRFLTPDQAVPISRRTRAAGHAAVLGMLVLAAAYAMWTLGADWGLRDGSQPLDVQERLLLGTSAAWCAVTAAALWQLLARTSTRVGRSLLFLGSGSLGAWGGWRLVIIAWDPPGLSIAQLPGVAVAIQVAGIVTGVAGLTLLLRGLPNDGCPGHLGDAIVK